MNSIAFARIRLTKNGIEPESEVSIYPEWDL
jgi:hypothetical protein